MTTPGKAGTRLPLPFRLYLTGQLLSALGSSFTAFAIPLLVFRLTGSATGLAFSLAVSMLPYLLFGLVIGALTDRLNRRRLMIGADLGRVVILFAVPLVGLVGELQVWLLYVTAFLAGTLGIVFSTGAFASVRRLVGADELVRANGALEAATSTARLVGPALAGLVTTVLPLEWVLAIDAMTFLASAVILMLVRSSLDPPASETGSGEHRRSGAVVRSLGTDIREGIAYIWGNPVLRSIAAMMSMVNFLNATVLAQLVLLADQRLDASAAQVAWLFGAGELGILVTSLLAARLGRRLPLAVLVLGSQFVCSCAVIALGFTTEYLLALPVWAVFNGVAILFNITTTSLRQRIVPDELLGRVMSVSAVLAWSAIPLGALLGGLVVDAVGDIGTVYAGIGTVTAVLTLLFVASPLRRPDSHVAAAPPGPGVVPSG